MPAVPYLSFGETSGFVAAVLIMLIIAGSLYVVSQEMALSPLRRHKVIRHRSARLGRVLLALERPSAPTGVKVVPCRPVLTLRDFSYDAWKQDRRCRRGGSCRLRSLGTPSVYALGRDR
jgi:hypothetical protein